MSNKNYFGGPGDYRGKGKESIDSSERTTSRASSSWGDKKSSSGSSQSGSKTKAVTDKSKKSIFGLFKK